MELGSSVKRGNGLEFEEYFFPILYTSWYLCSFTADTNVLMQK
jgi:hypothetical protein